VVGVVLFWKVGARGLLPTLTCLGDPFSGYLPGEADVINALLSDSLLDEKKAFPVVTLEPIAESFDCSGRR
jgi:hypothetical protein